MDKTSLSQQPLFAFQDRILAVVQPLQTGFYLSGRAAASRGYLNHRMTNEMVFACNDRAEYGIWSEQVMEQLLTQVDLRAELVVREARRQTIALQLESRSLMVVLFNDGPLHLGKVRSHAEIGQLDSPENIAAQAVVALVSAPEPGDLADLLGLCLRFNLSLETLIRNPESKAAGVFAPDLARVLFAASKEDWEMVRWIQRPPLNVFLSQLKRLAESLIIPDPSLLKPAVSTPGAPGTSTMIPASQDSSHSTGAAEAPTPAEMPEPPGIKHGTGILNFYRAMKAAGINEFGDEVKPDEDATEPAVIKPRLPYLPPLPDTLNPSSDVKIPPPPRPRKEETAATQPWAPTVVTGDVKINPPKIFEPVSHGSEPQLPVVPARLEPRDLRSEPRRHISYYLPVHNVADGGLVGYLSDISKHGVCLDSQGPLIKGSKQILRIDLPSELGPKPNLTFTAEVRWSRIDPTDPNAYNIGMEVIHITADDARSFIQIYEKFSTG